MTRAAGNRSHPDNWHLAAVGAVSCTAPTYPIRLGIVDTGIDKTHKQFDGLSVAYAEVRGGKLHEGRPHDDPHPTQHGTAVASLVAGAEVGVIPDCELAVCGLEYWPQSSPPIPYYATSLRLAFDWLATRAFTDKSGRAAAPDLIVCSSGMTPLTAELNRAIHALVNRRKIPLIAAVGHPRRRNNSCWYPAAHPNVVSVGAVDAKGGVWPYGLHDIDNPSVTAPGVDVRFARHGAFATGAGTSYATPVAAGAIARLIEAFGKNGNSLAHGQLLKSLWAGEIPASYLNQRTKGGGHGEGIISVHGPP